MNSSKPILAKPTLAQRILVVDDEAQISRVLRRSLAARGYEVQVASEGEEALEIFNGWTPDLVITDLSMPTTWNPTASWLAARKSI